MITLPNSTPLEKEIAKRVKRGIALLDEVTPRWWEPINPKTLHVSNREFCVFAQAKHSFREGIVQVAQEAVKKGVKVRLLDKGRLPEITGYSSDWWNEGRLKTIEGNLKGITIDVFHYGFDVDNELRQLAVPKGSRRAAWDAIDRAWKAVVIQKKEGK